MAESNKKFEALKRELLKDTDLACELIAHLTGQDVHLVQRLPPDELFEYLSYLLQQEKKKDLDLHWRHNKSAEELQANNSHAYVLEMRGLIANSRARSKKFGAKPVIYEMLRLLSGLAIAQQVRNPGRSSTSLGSSVEENQLQPVVNVRPLLSKPHVVQVMITNEPPRDVFKK
ncbi:MAG: hypothetical protein JSS50_02045 [Proteobacteria bacterium]|nr:hypothetical protein [Pseudomonadota bacterium]